MPERMDHEKMKRASELPVTGPAATDTLAASGGLELPGRAPEGITPDVQSDIAAARELVPPTAASLEHEAARTDTRDDDTKDEP